MVNRWKHFAACIAIEITAIVLCLVLAWVGVESWRLAIACMWVGFAAKSFVGALDARRKRLLTTGFTKLARPIIVPVRAPFGDSP